MIIIAMFRIKDFLKYMLFFVNTVNFLFNLLVFFFFLNYSKDFYFIFGNILVYKLEM